MRILSAGIIVASLLPATPTPVVGQGEVDLTDPITFSGFVECGVPLEETSSSGPDGRESYEAVVATPIAEMTDPRLEGVLTQGQTLISVGADDRHHLGRFRWHIENASGAWRGAYLQTFFAGGVETTGPIELVGDGAYDGLVAIGLVTRSDEVCGWDVEGIILDTKDVPVVSESTSGG